MPSIYDLKSDFQNILRPSVRKLAAKGFTANQVTVLAFALSCLIGWLVWAGAAYSIVLLLIPLFLFARMALNAIDGMLAREHGQKSNLGAILNELGDVFSDAALYVPFLLAIDAPLGLTFLITVLSLATEMTGVVAVQIGASRRYDGPMGKSDRAFVFSVLAVVCVVTTLSQTVLNLVLCAIALLLVVTVLNRIRMALAEAGAR